MGAGSILPADLREYYSVRGSIVGCNRIKCRDCGAWVRHFDNCRLAAITVGLAQYEALYEASDPLRFDFISSTNGVYRVYCCRCAFADTPSANALPHLDLPNWYCAGHPQG